MAGLKPTFEGVINSINKYISLIPMCFVSWLVWLMIHNPYYVILLITLGFWFSIPLIIWAIVGMGMYSYRIYNRPMNAEEINDYNEDEMFIPYTDRVLFEYGGGVFGPQIFGDEREEFMKKHPVK